MATTPAPARTGSPDEEDLAGSLALAFTPLHKRAFGTACGLAAGLLLAGATLVYYFRATREQGAGLWLLSQYFAGYEATPVGALIGFAWGGVVGFVAGWFIAFCRNLVIAASLFWIRTRSELAATRDFLDHI